MPSESPSGLSEFSLIDQIVVPRALQRDDVVLGIGDDAALLSVSSNSHLVVALDTLVAGRHFFVDQAPEDIAWKALAVNLSDLAAMGAVPKWALLSLALPSRCVNSDWMSRFMQGWQQLAQTYQVALVGGDTTASDCLSVSVTLMGQSVGASLMRSGAQEGDALWVSGDIGGAGLALAQLLSGVSPSEVIAEKLHRPSARVSLGQALVGLATSAIDVSDGLLADLSHLMEKSDVGAEVNVDRVPLSPLVREWSQQVGWEMPLTSGDDYELLFTVPTRFCEQVFALQSSLGVDLTCIGKITTKETGLSLFWDEKPVRIPERRGYDHFATAAII